MNKPLYLIVHHTGGSDIDPLQDSSNFTFEQCNEQHRKSFNMKSSLGFYIGYHYYIDKLGKVTQGRADTDEGAHTIGRNSESIGICLAGNFDATLPTEIQKVALAELLKRLSAKYGIPTQNIVPHRFFGPKTCYGNKLADNWARSLIIPAPPTSPTAVLTRDQRIAKASALIAEAMELLKGV